MAPSMLHVRALVARETEYAMAPFWIVLLVLLAAGFALLSVYAIGRHFFPPAAIEPTVNEDEQGMTQMQYQRQLRLRNQEQLQSVYGFRDIPRQPAGIYSGQDSGHNSMVSY